MFEQLLYTHLMSCNQLSDYLARYDGKLAVFNQTIPDANDEKWSEERYAHIVFFTDMHPDKRRKIDGILKICIYCNESTNHLDDIVSIVKENINDYFFSGDGENIVAQWKDTRCTKDSNIISGTMIFQLLSFPMQQSGNEKDPVKLVNEYSKEKFPNAMLIGFDEINDVWKPSDTVPALYWRLSAQKNSERILPMYQTTWYDTTLHLHIISSDIALQNAIAQTVQNDFNGKKVLCFDDGSYMRVDWENILSLDADVFRRGQLTVEATYCTYFASEPAEKLKYLHIKED